MIKRIIRMFNLNILIKNERLKPLMVMLGGDTKPINAPFFWRAGAREPRPTPNKINADTVFSFDYAGGYGGRETPRRRDFVK